MLFGKRVVQEKDRADRDRQHLLKNYLHRNLIVEDMTELECQFIVRVQTYYKNRDNFTPEEQVALEKELSDLRKSLSSTRAFIEQLVKAGEGKAYGENATFIKQ